MLLMITNRKLRLVWVKIAVLETPLS